MTEESVKLPQTGRGEISKTNVDCGAKESPEKKKSMIPYSQGDKKSHRKIEKRKTEGKRKDADRPRTGG